jgi:hypothetical protein
MLSVKQFSSFITFWFFANTEYGSFWVKSERTKTYTNSLKNNKTMVQKKTKKTKHGQTQFTNLEYRTPICLKTRRSLKLRIVLYNSSLASVCACMCVSEWLFLNDNSARGVRLPYQCADTMNTVKKLFLQWYTSSLLVTASCLLCVRGVAFPIHEALVYLSSFGLVVYFIPFGEYYLS